MGKLTLEEMRSALVHVSSAENILRMSDEELLSANLQKDLLLDSLELLELSLELQHITGAPAPDSEDFHTVQELLKAWNEV